MFATESIENVCDVSAGFQNGMKRQERVFDRLGRMDRDLAVEVRRWKPPLY